MTKLFILSLMNAKRVTDNNNNNSTIFYIDCSTSTNVKHKKNNKIQYYDTIIINIYYIYRIWLVLLLLLYRCIYIYIYFFL